MKQYRLLLYTNKLLTINYQQILALFSKKSNNLHKVNGSVGYEMQRFFTLWNSLKCHSRKNLNCQVHQDMKLNAGL